VGKGIGSKNDKEVFINLISIDVTAEQHQQLKALATLETLLDRRLAGAQNRVGARPRSGEQVFQDAKREHSGEPQED